MVLKIFYSLNGCGIEKGDLLSEIRAISEQIENEGKNTIGCYNSTHKK